VSALLIAVGYLLTVALILVWNHGAHRKPDPVGWCRRCRQPESRVGPIKGNVCGSCADDLRQEEMAAEMDMRP